MRRKAMRFHLPPAAIASMFVGGLIAGSGALAHPAFDPFDDTIFAPIDRLRIEIGLEGVSEGLTAPLKGRSAPGEPSRLYVVDQPGTLWAIELATGEKTVFLDVSDRLVALGFLGPGTFDERGFLGLAFHPGYADNGRFYTYTSEPNGAAPTLPTTLPAGTDADHQSVVAEWRANDPGDPGAGVDPASHRELLRTDQPQFNHDGGELGFGRDGMLYVSLGDGGGADDQGVGHGPGGNAQDLTNPLGAILRIDVDGSSAANGQYGIPADNPFVGAGGGVIEEIFAYGFRNPFRFSFDSRTGELYVGDVGQNDIEEVDRVVAGGNFGWNRKEGTLFFDPNGADPGFASPVDPGGVPRGLVDPIAQYDTHHEGHSVIGGFVYRGDRIHKLRRRYVFGDFSSLFKFPSGPHDYGRLFHLRADRADDALRDGKLLRITEFRIVPGNRLNLALLGFGQDADGELYALGNVSGVPFGDEGVVVKIVPVPEEDEDDDRHDHDHDDDDD
jgi:hypothetical protein